MSTVRINKRRHEEWVVKGRHLTIDEIISEKNVQNQPLNNYLEKKVLRQIPLYPQPVEFHISKLQHVTTLAGVQGIMNSQGFSAGSYQDQHFSWWSLYVSADDITDAEQRFLQSRSPPAQLEGNQPILDKFTTSPTFLPSSRYGNFKFTIDLVEMLQKYSEQFCNDQRPVLRVYETVLYSQEIVKSVVVHSPDTRDFDDYPLFPEKEVFKNGIIVWRPEAMSETHRYQLVYNPEQNRYSANEITRFPQFYVWDHLVLAFHVKKGQVFKFDQGLLVKNLSACGIGQPCLTKETCPNPEYMVERYKARFSFKK